MRISKDIDVLATYVGKPTMARQPVAPGRTRARRIADIAQAVILVALLAAAAAVAITVSGIDVNLLPLG